MSVNTHQIRSFIKHFFVAKRKGHGVHSPFAYKLCEEVFYNTDSFYAFKQLDLVRKHLLVDETILEIEDFGAGSKTLNDKSRKIKDIAAKGISSQKQSEILFKLLNFLKCETVIELGTSLGLNTLYLSMVNSNTKIISLEGDKSLSDFASQLSNKYKQTNTEFVHAKFDDILPSLLQKINTLDLFYVDGNHTYSATMRYFEMALPKKNQQSVFVFDDIYWSPEMTKAWEEIKKHPSVKLSIDTFYFGLVFFDEGIKEKVDLRMYL